MKRCQNGTRRNKKTLECEPKTTPNGIPKIIHLYWHTKELLHLLNIVNKQLLV